MVCASNEDSDQPAQTDRSSLDTLGMAKELFFSDQGSVSISATSRTGVSNIKLYNSNSTGL